MRIELKDRQYWIDYCDAKIKQVKARRKELDEQFEKKWRKRSWPFKDRKESEKPDIDSMSYMTRAFYPSRVGWGTLDVAEKLKKVLEDHHTNIVTLSGEEYELLK